MPDQILDPTQIPCTDLPLIVFVDDRRSFIGFGIKNHSKGNYNHVMIMHKPGLVASMDFSGFHQRPITDYLRNNLSLKFWKYTKATEQQNVRLLLETFKMLPSKTDSWWKKLTSKFSYDFTGILGQLLNIRWIQNPFKWYCSEITAFLLMVAYGLTYVGKRPSPADLNEQFKLRIGWQVYGRWYSDDD